MLAAAVVHVLLCLLPLTQAKPHEGSSALGGPMGGAQDICRPESQREASNAVTLFFQYSRLSMFIDCCMEQHKEALTAKKR